MFDIRKWIRIHLILISSLQGLPQNQNLATLLVCIVDLCFPHGTIVWVHMCERLVYRHEAILLIVRECCRFNPRRWRHCGSCAGQRRGRQRKRKSRSERWRGRRQNEDHQTLAQTCDIMDGMWMEWLRTWDTLSHDMRVITCAKCIRKNTCEVFLSTPPVGYSGSLSTVNDTNCN